VLHVSLARHHGHAAIRHRRTHEWVYVLKGPVTAEVDGHRLVLRKGDGLYLPPGVWHSFRARGLGSQALSFFSPAIDWERLDVERRGRD